MSLTSTLAAKVHVARDIPETSDDVKWFISDVRTNQNATTDELVTFARYYLGADSNTIDLQKKSREWCEEHWKKWRALSDAEREKAGKALIKRKVGRPTKASQQKDAAKKAADIQIALTAGIEHVRGNSNQPLYAETVALCAPQPDIWSRDQHCLTSLLEVVASGKAECYYDSFTREEVVRPGKSAERFKNLQADAGVDHPNIGVMKQKLSACLSNPKVGENDVQEPFSTAQVTEALRTFVPLEHVNSFHQWVKRVCVPAYNELQVKQPGRDLFKEFAATIFGGCCDEYDMADGDSETGKRYVVEVIQCIYRALICRGCVDVAEGVDFPLLWALESDTQGWGKSDISKNIVPTQFWTDSDNLCGEGKNVIPALAGMLVCEVGEMKSMYQKEAAHLKAFLSMRHMRFRGVYEKKAKKSPIRTVFIATGNLTQYHADGSGGRRHAPFRINKHVGDTDWILHYQRALLGQAYLQMQDLIVKYDANIDALQEGFKTEGEEQVNYRLSGVDAIYRVMRAKLSISQDLWGFRESLVKDRSITTSITDALWPLHFKSTGITEQEEIVEYEGHLYRVMDKLGVRKYASERLGSEDRPVNVTDADINRGIHALGWKNRKSRTRKTENGDVSKFYGRHCYFIPIKGHHLADCESHEVVSSCAQPAANDTDESSSGEGLDVLRDE